ncbi:3-oxoacyl-[acyl-carrier protein] reductase [Chromohalobacter marismortui]|uniref:3-oxoacyl-[acyl-carrier protein] reductase n=1 Tax=Chromohalobacter marismortui TaxID=42055 RepID=A0A4R7NMY3_9GAMM|nr:MULTISPECIES: 3-oxoacyl-ACP reductase FabG [Chromohalobacter]MCI0510242.1 3-oxoacyl-ACP reductase FabG [Chromohalobacter sp.]MCI0593418.1 3-oxoacyl-ACP reductase FabG [Chromohalobacter sp.]TDU21660.1 3-oxoacyl-[acyl-carrier protein] reductase [Chromohalobacter marismortui]
MTDTILVTGASRGIGRATALRLAHDGFDIVLHYRSREQDAERVAEEIRALGREARLLCFDVADRDQARTLLEADIEAHGTYFGVVCNAGITADNPFPALTGDNWDSVVHTNLDGFYNVLHPLVMPMIQRRKPGRIVTIASMSGLIGNRGQVNYSAAKAGVIGATKALAIELAKRHITVNCVAPGWIDTDMTHHLSQEEVRKLIPMRRTGQAEDIAGVVSFLCSQDAAYMTRQVLPVNGGMC